MSPQDRRALAVAFCLASTVDVSAQAGPFTLEDCIRLALSSPSAVSAARHQSEIAALGVKIAWAAMLPPVRVNGAFTYNSPPKPGSDQPSYVALNGVKEYSGLVSVVQELDTSGRLRAARARARADQDSATANLGITERDLKRLVTGSYHRVLLARRLAHVARDALAESQAFEARTKRLFENGEVARADVVKAGAQSAFLDQAVSAADLEAQVTNHELAAFWTADVAAPLPLRDILDDPVSVPPEPAPASAVAPPFARRPELALFDAQRRGFLADSRRAHAERLPQGTFMLQYGLDSTQLRWEDRGYAVFFSLDTPIFDWFKGRSAARQFELQADQVDINRRVAERAFSKEYQDALSRARLIHDQIATTGMQVRLSEENLRLSRVRYDGGEGSALDVVAAQTQLVQSRTNYYTAVVGYLESRADLRVASGE